MGVASLCPPNIDVVQAWGCLRWVYPPSACPPIIDYVHCAGVVVHAAGVASLCLPTFLPQSDFTLYLPIVREGQQQFIN